MHKAAVCAFLVMLPSTGLAGPYLTKMQRHVRARDALAARTAEVQAAFEKVGAAWPPNGIYLRGFKDDAVLELFASPADPTQPWARVRDFPICARSGSLGPKRSLSDRQVPEGFYQVDRVNPWSLFHLSLGINYPNAFDKRRFRHSPAKADIFIHGACVTIGCLPLRDGPMEALFVAALHARDHGQRWIPVHLFPCRLHEKRCRDRLDGLSAANPGLAAFWQELEPGYQRFQQTGVPPAVRVGRGGHYTISAK
jgi:murein L,D-transpeptidase YafK